MDILPFNILPVLYWICIRSHWKYTQIKATIVASHILVLYVLYFCCLTWNVGHTMNGMVFLVVYNFCIFDSPSLSCQQVIKAWWSLVVILPVAETVCKTFADQCLSNVDVSALLFPFCICIRFLLLGNIWRMQPKIVMCRLSINYVRMNIVSYDNCFTQYKHNLKEMNKEITNTVRKL